MSLTKKAARNKNTSFGVGVIPTIRAAGVGDRPGQGCGRYGMTYKSAIWRINMNGAQSVTGTTSALIDSVTVQDLGRHEPYSELPFNC